MNSVIRVGLVMALALLGDALLYLALPAYAARLGMPLWTVGILLSANRIVRLVTNGGASWAFGKLGQWPLMIAASLGAVVTTAAYGLTTALGLLLIARASWGACYSILRLGGQMTVLSSGTPRTRGRLMGLFQALSRSGPTIGVVLGGFALERLGYQTTFVILALVSAVGVPLAWGLPRVAPPPPAPPANWRTHIFGGQRLVAVKSAALFNGLSFHGMIVPTIVLALMAAGQTSGATELGGILVGLRSGSDMLLATPMGYLSDRLGRGRALPMLLALEGTTILALAGGLSVGVGAVVGLLLLLFVLSTAVGTVTDAAAGDLAPGVSRAQVMSSYANWIDLGSAIGPAVGLALVGILGLRVTYIGGGLLILFSALQFSWVARAYPWPAALTDDHASAD